MSKKSLTSNAVEERLEFAARLRSALKHAGYCPQERNLTRRFNAATSTRLITEQSVGKWLRGQAMPKESNRRALVALPGIAPECLRFGESRIEATDGRDKEPDPRRGLAFELASISESDAKLVRELVKILLLHQRSQADFVQSRGRPDIDVASISPVF